MFRHGKYSLKLTQTPLFWKICSWGILLVGALCFGGPSIERCKVFFKIFPDLWVYVSFYIQKKRKPLLSITSIHVALLLVEFPWEQMHQYPNTLERHLLRTTILVQTRCTKGTWNLPLHLKWISLPGIFPSCLPAGFIAPPESWGAQSLQEQLYPLAEPIPHLFLPLCLEEAPSATAVFSELQQDQERWGILWSSYWCFPGNADKTTLPLIGSTTNIYSCEKKFADPTTVAMVAYLF